MQPAADEQVKVPTARWLVSPAGRDAVAAAADVLRAGGDTLHASEAVRSRSTPPSHAAAAVSCAVARLDACEALVGGDDLLFTEPAWQQASHPQVARWRARRYAQAPIVTDLCSGCGVDALALAAAGPDVVALDHDEARVLLLRHNVAARAAAVAPLVADACRPPVRDGGLVHCDPSRRADGRRARRLADYTPPVGALTGVLRAAAGAGLVLSPAVALDDPDLPPGGELEFVQVGQDLVEAVLWLGDLRTPGVRARATLLPAGHSLCRSADGVRLAVGDPGDWLVEVAPAAVRARLHGALGRSLGAWKLARRRALLTTRSQPPASPWWRRWRVEAVLPPRPAHVRRWLRQAGEHPLEIATAGMQADPDAWWRDLGRPDRGPGGRRLLLTRLDRGGRAIMLRPG